MQLMVSVLKHLSRQLNFLLPIFLINAFTTCFDIVETRLPVIERLLDIFWWLLFLIY